MGRFHLRAGEGAQEEGEGGGFPHRSIAHCCVSVGSIIMLFLLSVRRRACPKPILPRGLPRCQSRTAEAVGWVRLTRRPHRD